MLGKLLLLGVVAAGAATMPARAEIINLSCDDLPGEIIVMSNRIVFTSIIALFALSSSVALADDCSWSPRGGTLNGACKDQAGHPYCLSCPADGGSCSKVPCPTPASGSGQ